MKRQLELDTIPLYGHSDNRALTGKAEKWTYLLPFKRWCLSRGVPNELVHLIVCQILIPLRDRIDKEMMVITVMRWNIRTMWPNRRDPERTSYEADLDRRARALHTGVVDDCLAPYLRVLKMMIPLGVTTVDEVLHVLQQGIREDSLLALGILHNANMFGPFQWATINSLIQRATQKYSAKKTWLPDDIEDMTVLIEYYLDKKEEEPIMEWLTVWIRKGLNMCKHAMFTIVDETRREQMALLITKQCSPEMKQRRLNVLMHNVYSDVICQ